MKNIVVVRRKALLWAIILIIIAPIYIRCSKNDTLFGPVYEADVYIIGYHPCVAQSIVTTALGEGRGFLVETIGANPDTLMVYGVPANMFNTPGEWFFHSCGHLFPEEGQKKFKMRISYQESPEKISNQFVCNTVCQSPSLYFNYDEYIIVKSKKIE